MSGLTQHRTVNEKDSKDSWGCMRVERVNISGEDGPFLLNALICQQVSALDCQWSMGTSKERKREYEC